MSSKSKLVVIRNFRGIESEPVEENERRWSELEVAIIAMLRSPNYSVSFERLHRIAEDLFIQKYSKLYTNLQVLVECYLKEKLIEVQNDNSKPFLERINGFWKEFRGNVKILKNIFLNYDRSPNYYKHHTVQSTSFELFISIIILNQDIKIKLVNDILKDIELERNGYVVDNVLLQSLIDMLNTLKIYEDIFQEDFLKSSRDFYEDEGNKVIQILSTSEYLSYVNRRVEEEHERIKSYLNKHMEKLLMDVVLKQLVENHIPEILDKGFDELIDNNMHGALTFTYQLFQKISGATKHLLDYFNQYVTEKGITITDPKNEKNMIQDLLNFKDDLEKTVEVSFQNKHEFHECIRKAFKNFVNNYHAKTARLLAKYLDGKLRSKDIADEDLEVILIKVIKLFRHVQGKDIFEAFYRKLLARRLLLGKLINQEGENSMISKLREECGSVFTSNIEGMFQDMTISKTVNSSFKQKLQEQENNDSLMSDSTIYVLTSSYWPTYPNFDVILPADLITYQQIFQTYYLASFSGRKLLWQPSLSHCLVKANFPCGIKELQVSIFQAIVLLLFNTTIEIKFTEMQERINLDSAELKRTLLSLTYGKSKILIQSPKGREIEEQDLFTINEEFTDKFVRVKVNQLQLQESVDEDKLTEKNVLVDRQFQIDAAIVRIMKNKKTVQHNVLVAELYNTLDIPVTQTDLKKRIELLIEREYMERDKENKSTYIYIA